MNALVEGLILKLQHEPFIYSIVGPRTVIQPFFSIYKKWFSKHLTFLKFPQINGQDFSLNVIH